jgi:hypothetical protein
MPKLVGKDVGEVGFGLMGMHTPDMLQLLHVLTQQHRNDLAPEPTASLAEH